jgi:hypothetical protein
MNPLQAIWRVATVLLMCYAAASAQSTPAAYEPATECDEFLSHSPCVITISMTPVAEHRVPTHADVQTKVGGHATVRLVHASPLIGCTVQAAPSVPARDLSTSVSSSLTTLASLGAPPAALAAAADTDPAEPLRKALKQYLHDDWQPTFPTEDAAKAAVGRLAKELPNLLDLEAAAEARAVGADAATARGEADLSDLRKFRDTVKQYLSVVTDANMSNKPLTEINISLDRFRQKSVAETITCKDAATQNQAFSTMTFTAYYENTPHFDISAGAIASLTPGRQVGAVASPLSSSAVTAPTSGACTASSPPGVCLEATSRSAYQFMPAAFFEIHVVNWKWPWAENGRMYHRFGYLGSIGPVLGIAANPNNGTATAELFEGLSVAIQRISLMVGLHNGRYQTFADGYYVGEEVPAGTTPRTERGWTNHLAFGISYRIPLH